MKPIRSLLVRNAVVPAVQKAPDQISGLTAWLDFTDASNMYTDAGATTPVTNGGNPIRIRNKANSAIWNKAGSGTPSFSSAGTGGGTSELVITGTDYWAAASGAALSNYIAAASYTAVFLVACQGVIGSTSWVDGVMMGDSGGYVYGEFKRTSNQFSFGVMNWDGGPAYAQNPGLINDSAWAVVTLQHVSGNIRCRVNRNSWTTTASGNTQVLTNALNIGNTTAQGTWRYKHATVYNVVVGNTDLEQLENYMAAKAGITL